eukprot:UN08050
MLSSSSPQQLQPTQGLKVNIDCKSSFSFPQSVSGTPSNVSNVSNDSYNNNIPTSYPDTPIISDNISYTNTQLNTPQPPITPITPADTAQTQKPKHSNDASGSASGQFPDTIAVNNIE